MKKTLKTLIVILTFICFLADIEGQVIAVDEYCISNTFTENGTMNERALYGPVAGIYIFWDEPESKWTIGSLDKSFLYYVSDDNSTGPGCTPTFQWTAPAGSACEVISVGGTACSIVLPVEYMSFTAVRALNIVKLEWTTALEINNEGFDVERSEDGKNFEKIGRVKGKGTSSFPSSYDFVDRERNANESHYYRLRQFDFNGEYEYSDLIYVSGDRKISENSVNYDQLTNSLNLHSSHARLNLRYQIFTSDGQLITTNSIDIQNGNNTVRLGNVPSGVYIFAMENEALRFVVE